MQTTSLNNIRYFNTNKQHLWLHAQYLLEVFDELVGAGLVAVVLAVASHAWLLELLVSWQTWLWFEKLNFIFINICEKH